jgi:hypothetical protein
MFRQLTIKRKFDRYETIILQDGDQIKEFPGSGIELTFASSPRTHTFYPYHRIWAYDTIDAAPVVAVDPSDEDDPWDEDDDLDSYHYGNSDPDF